MSTVEHLFRQFTEADRAGGEAPDPLRWIAQVRGAEREELTVLIEEYLARAPRRPFDAVAFADSPARALTEDLARALDGEAGAWPALLPRLRHRARLSRAQLVARLAEVLGVPGQQEAVLGYYHAMEQGTLPADGVTDRVLEALGGIVGETAAALRAAGAGLAAAGGGAAAGGAAFARLAEPDPSYPAPAPAAAAPPPPAPAPRGAARERPSRRARRAVPPPPASPGTTASDAAAAGSPPAAPDVAAAAGPAPDPAATVEALFTGRRSG